MSDPDPTRLVRAFYDQAWNCWDDEVVDELLTVDFRFRGSLGDEVTGRDGWRGYRDALRAAVPDFHNEVVDLVCGPGRAAVRLRCTGHVEGSLLGVVGHGRPISYAAAAFFTCDGGQLASAWVLGDLAGLRTQLTTRPRS